MLRLATCLTEQHDPILVGLAALICALGAHATIDLLRQAASGVHARRWLLATAVTGGTAVWCTHFVAMLAFAPGLAASYAPGPTLASLGLAIVALLGAFAVALARAPALGGALAGAGIGAMHYLGMAGYGVAGEVIWDPGMVAASLLLGTGLAAAALRLGVRQANPWWRLVATVLLVLAICALHFIGMAAMTLLPDPARHVAGGLPPDWLAGAVAAGGLAVLGLGLLGAAAGRHDARREAGRLRTLADAAVEGLLVCDGDTVITANASAAAILGRSVAALQHQPLRALLGDAALAATLTAGGGTTWEGEVPRPGEAPVPVELVSRVIEYAGRPHHVVALRDLSDRRRAEERIRFLAHHDALTGLPNRVSFAEALARVLETRDPRDSFAVLALDLDRFKIINDTLGHPVGDALLVKVAERLRAAVRAGDLVCRLGGDEFMVVQLTVAQPEGATALAQRLVDLLARPFLVDGQVLNVGTSVGVALFPADGADAATLNRNADLALYRAKADGRGTYRFFEVEMDSRMQRRRALEVELRAALSLRQFELMYQPLVDTASDRIAGFEALIRWRHPQRGMIPPSDFIPLAEETGLIVPIGEWVLREACREAAGWPADISIAVNLSPVQFRSAGLVGAVRAACQAARLDPRRLELEVTESVLLTDNAQTLSVLRDLKGLGARVSMDDFGTGYSSLSYLRSFPFDKIKIDRSFVTDVTENAESAAIVQAIIGLGRSLQMKTTIEGVETEAQLQHLRHEGCDQVQGYVVSRPLPPAAVRALLQPDAAAA